MGINLLPVEQRKSRSIVNNVLLIVGIIVLFIFSCTYAYGVYNVWSLERQLADAESQYALLRFTEGKMNLANEKQKNINAKNNLLTKLTKERKSYNAIVMHLGIVTPQEVWLKEIGQGDKEKEKNVVSIKGIASSYQDLANFLMVLEQDEFFAEPTLVTADSTEGKKGANFEITVKLKGM